VAVGIAGRAVGDAGLVPHTKNAKRRPCVTLPSQYIWLASSFGACNEMPEVPAREQC
jgi:hypothetical protein